MQTIEELVPALVLYANCSINEARATPILDAQAFLRSKPFADWMKNRENEWKIQGGIADRLNEVIKAIGSLGKLLARR